MTLKGALVGMIEYWPQLPDTAGIPSPIKFTVAGLEGFLDEEELLFSLNKLDRHLQGQIGSSDDGWVKNERYGEAARKVEELKASFLEVAEGNQDDIHLMETGSPFRDCEEVS